MTASPGEAKRKTRSGAALAAEIKDGTLIKAVPARAAGAPSRPSNGVGLDTRPIAKSAALH
jgi:hypothetical protein